MDLRYALRMLLAQPLFTLGAVLTLALGIGANGTIFTFANAALFRPMPGIADPDALVWVSAVWQDRGREVRMSYPEYLDYRDAMTTVFSDLVGFRSTPVSLGSGREPLRVRGQMVTGNFFTTLGVIPGAGRLLTSADDEPGGAPVVVLSDRLWRQQFGGSPDILSSPIIINGHPFTVVGIAPDGFHGPALGETADLWLPIARIAEARSSDRALLTDRGASWLLVMGRLSDQVSVASAQAAASAVATRLASSYPETQTNRTVHITDARSGLAPEGRGELVPLGALLLVVTGIVLMIACANVANLLLARGAARSLEISIRASLGASRRRLIRQFLTESALLAAAGTVGGLLLSFWAADLLQAQLPEEEFRGLYAFADMRVLLFTLLVGTLSVCGFGLAPALTLTRGALQPRLRETTGSGGRTRLQGIFVVSQLALSLVLLLAGGLSLRAVQKSTQVDPGFEPGGVLTASYDLALQNYTPERRVAFRRLLRERIAALPGVTDVSISNVPPLSGTMVGTVVSSKGTAGGEVESRTYLNAAGPAYFETLHLPIVGGRGFVDGDTAGAPHVAVVNETLARNLWANDDPLGREITVQDLMVRVVGVARNSKYDEVTEDPRPFMYLSIDQNPQLDRETVLVRADGAMGALTPAVRAAIQALDPALPVFDVRPLATVLTDRNDKQRAVSALLAGFGTVALLLAALGLYGVMAYAVARRTREMGIRLALGATPSQLTALIARDGLRLSALGVAIGGILALPMAYALGALLFGVQIADVAGFGLVCLVLVVVGMIAAVLPARRAGRLDPLAALRSE
jgi:putative ABC transport system permease protein